jgi:hypothetical protein
MVTIGDKELVLVNAYQCVPDGRIQVFALYRIAIGNIVKHLNGIVNHDEPFHDWRRQHENLLQVFFEPISHAQLLNGEGRWMP